jgi:hypothetical protein
VSVIAAAALCAVATASPSAARQVTYFASGAFSTPALSGEDQAGVAGSPFIISFVIDEDAIPVQHAGGTAEYSSVPVNGKIYIDTGTNIFLPLNGPASLYLVCDAPDQPDWIILQLPLPTSAIGTIEVTAKILLPPGTLTTPAIRPFAAPVPFLPSNARVTYACPACPPPYTGLSTTLAIQGGSLNATLQ